MKNVVIGVAVVGVGGLTYWLWKNGKFNINNAGPPKTNPAPSMCSQVLTGAANIAVKTGDPKTVAGGVAVGVTAPALCKAASWAVGKVVEVGKGIYNTAGAAGKLVGNTAWQGAKEIGGSVSDVGSGIKGVFTNTKAMTVEELKRAQLTQGAGAGGFAKKTSPFGITKPSLSKTSLAIARR